MTIDEVLTRGVKDVLPSKKGLADLMAKKKIKLYLGIDPTAPRLHLGHTVPLRKLQQFADLGHEVILLFGTGTVLAGDPSQRSSARKKIAAEQIEHNISDWKNQVKNIIDFNKVNVMYNGEWLLKLNLRDIIEIASHISAAQLIKRDMFKRRIKKNDTIWTHEILYPLLQGYDSVAMDVDLEIGGNDQTFNMLIGRELQQKMNNHEKFVLTTPMIVGTDGNSMSKTAGNSVWLNDVSADMYGKLMGISDDQIETYMLLVTSMSTKDINLAKKGKVIDTKKRLAYEVVKELHSKNAAEKAQDDFETTFQKGKPSYSKTVPHKDNLLNLVAQIVKSKSEAKRLISQGAVDVDETTVQEPKHSLKGGERVKIGKTTFVKVKKHDE